MALQSTFGDSDIAEELAAEQRQISIAEFFEKNKHMLGFDSKARALITAVKEAVDNALDAAQDADIRPNIYVKIEDAGDYYRVIVEDNGPGITKDQIPNVFGKLLYGSRFHKREQNRGQQGIGISAAVLYSQLTSGKPTKIKSKTSGSDEANYVELTIDTDTNEPKISLQETRRWEPTHGTRITLELEANMRARKQLHRYIEHTAVVNPHATIKLEETDDTFYYEYTTDELPEDTREIRPHPHGIELGTLIKMLDASSSHSISGFLQGEFSRVGKTTSDEIIDNFRDHYLGREMAWRVQVALAEDLQPVIKKSIANKSRESIEQFSDFLLSGVDYVVGEEDGFEIYRLAQGGDDGEEVVHLEGLHERARVAHFELVDSVNTASNLIEHEFETTFGSTVRENVVGATWKAIREHLESDLYSLIDDATSTRKDDETVQGIAERIANKFENDSDPRGRVTKELLRQYIDRSADMTEERLEVSIGDTARENILETLWGTMLTVPDEPPKLRNVDRDAARDLLKAMRDTDIISPPTDCLSPITDDLIKKGLERSLDAEFYAAETRDAEVYGGDPFVVEAGIAYGGDLDPDGKVDLMRFANRVPLVYQQGACAMTDVIKSINWRNYELDQPGGTGFPNGPAVVLVHVASTNVPFTSESKDAVANISEIEKEIELAIREAARDLKTHLNKRKALAKRRQKQSVLADILPKMAEKVASITGRQEPDVSVTLARVMNNVLMNRRTDNGRVELSIENNSDASIDLDVTEMVTAKPTDVSDGKPVDMGDGEWYIKWSPRLGAGDEVTLTYAVAGEPSFDVNVDGIEPEKLTVEQ